MEDTCKKKECWFYLLMRDLLKQEPEFENCPFYTETIWTPISVDGKTESAKVLKDCANRRGLLTLLEDVHPRLMGVQKSNEEMRNRVESTAAQASMTLAQMANAILPLLEEKRCLRELESKGKVKTVTVEDVVEVRIEKSN